jgi:hypothetical protein
MIVFRTIGAMASDTSSVMGAPASTSNAMAKPKVSVLMTIYNAGPYLYPAIASLLAETYRDFELVAIENGSTDGSVDVARQFSGKDRRVRLIELPENIGRTPALNLALKEARGEYVAILDADDITAPERLQRQVALLDAKPDVVLVACHVHMIDGEGNIIGEVFPPTETAALRDAIAYSNPFQHSSCMMRRGTVIELGGYSDRYKFAMDFALWIALARKGEVAMIGEPLACIRDHGSRLTHAPSYALIRCHEQLELFGAALRLPGLSHDARRMGHTNIARLHARTAITWLQARRPIPALISLIKAVATDPLYWLRRVGGMAQPH